MGETAAPISPELFARQMQEIATGRDIESSHIEADNLMCELLRQLGYGDGVAVYEDMQKWYA